MKRLWFLLSVLLPGLLLAGNIPEEQARRVATAFWQSAPQTRGAVVYWQLVSQSGNLDTRSSGLEPAYYVYDNASGPGFVIVAGDDVAMPVLGYSFEHEFPQGELLPNVQGWLDGLREEINAARRDGVQAGEAVTRAWQEMRAGDVVVELQTALWNQDAPYNRLCPLVNGSATYTGCTATAMAIVMRYHQWPERGTGTLPAYTTITHNYSVPAQELGHSYEWDLMPLNYTNSSEAQNQAVATLMRDCAIAIQADFCPIGSSGTSALALNIARSLPSYFSYGRTARWVARASYPSDEWDRMMKDELDASRPIIYSGFNFESGHAFVLDGYTTDSYFSVNWGWGGYCNGYYLLSALEPADTGIGGGSNGKYNELQDAVIGIQKDDGSAGIEELRFSYYDNREGISGADKRIYNGFSVDETDIRPNEPFILHFGFLSNSGTEAFTGDILIALTDKDGQIVEELFQFTAQELPVGYGYMVDPEVVITQPILAGYRIRAYYRSERTPQWTVVRGNEEGGCVWDMVLQYEYTIEQCTSFTYNKTERKIYLATDSNVTVTLTGTDGKDYAGACRREGTSVTIDAAQLSAGTYVLTLQRGSEQKELRFTLGQSR